MIEALLDLVRSRISSNERENARLRAFLIDAEEIQTIVDPSPPPSVAAKSAHAVVSPEDAKAMFRGVSPCDMPGGVQDGTPVHPATPVSPAEVDPSEADVADEPSSANAGGDHVVVERTAQAIKSVLDHGRNTAPGRSADAKILPSIAIKKDKSLTDRVRAAHLAHPTWTASMIANAIGGKVSSISVLLSTIRKEESD